MKISTFIQIMQSVRTKQGQSLASLYKKTNKTYMTICDNINVLEKKEFIYTVKTSHEKKVFSTAKGMKLLEKCEIFKTDSEGLFEDVK